MTDECLFCRIARGDIRAAFLAETDDAVVFQDINPQAPVHALIIPRVHVDSLDTAENEQLLGRLMSLAADVARKQGVAEGGYRVVINTNANAGQSVPHLHIHVLGGRHLDWPPG